jgi:hypothetical protein
MNSMQMPQQAQPMQGAGLGAMIQAKGGDGAGASKQTMDQMMALAEKLPDSELADVLAGKSRRVPQFAAMLAAMGRESLRTAVAGAQAGQAKEPNKKDQMLAKMSGITALPAENMEQMGQGMAEGGIVGFSGEVDSFVEEREDRRTPFDRMLGNRYRPSRNQTVTPDPTNRNIDMVTGAISTGAIPYADAKLDNQINIDNQMSAAPSETGAPRGTAPRAAAPGIAPPAVAAPERRKSFLDGLDEGADDSAKRMAEGKSQAQGEFLMQLGASLLGIPNLGQALMQGTQKGLPGLAASRKETNAILKEQREYKLNMAKAKEAAAQGNDDLAFKYAKLAEDSKYQTGMVAAAMSRGAGNNQLATAAMNKAQDQLKLAMGDPRQRRNLGTVEAQQTFLNNAFQSNLSILSGQGPVTPRVPSYGALPEGEAPLSR